MNSVSASVREGRSRWSRGRRDRTISRGVVPSVTVIITADGCPVRASDGSSRRDTSPCGTDAVLPPRSPASPFRLDRPLAVLDLSSAKEAGVVTAAACRSARSSFTSDLTGLTDPSDLRPPNVRLCHLDRVAVSDWSVKPAVVQVLVDGTTSAPCSQAAHNSRQPSNVSIAYLHGHWVSSKSKRLPRSSSTSFVTMPKYRRSHVRVGRRPRHRIVRRPSPACRVDVIVAVAASRRGDPVTWPVSSGVADIRVVSALIVHQRQPS